MTLCLLVPISLPSPYSKVETINLKYLLETQVLYDIYDRVTEMQTRSCIFGNKMSYSLILTAIVSIISHIARRCLCGLLEIISG